MGQGLAANLEVLFKPNAVTVIGASADPRKLGGAVLRALVNGGFAAPVLPVNPRRVSVSGVLCYRSIAHLPITPDVAVICTPSPSVPGLIDELGRRGTRVAVIMTGDPEDSRERRDSAFSRKILEAARPWGVRLVGPGSTGIQVPGVGLNCSWIPTPALSGRVALISQSGSLATGVVDWAKARGIGFSHIISAGDAVDVDVGDFLDFLGSEASCQAILLYVRSVSDGRKFLSAARAAARWKRVIVVKPGRRADALRSSVGTAATIGATPSIVPDEAFGAAIRRAGMLRVTSIDELFDAVETLASNHTVRGDSLAILTNGYGPATIAADTVSEQGGRLATLTDATFETLARVVPGRRLSGNPVDIGRGASATQFAAAATTMIADPNVDSLLVMHTRGDLQPVEEKASAVINALAYDRHHVLVCWLGDGNSPNVRSLFSTAGIPVYDTPERAARGFLHLVRFYRNQEMLLQTPDRPPAMGAEQRRIGVAVVAAALARGERALSLEGAAALLAAYGIYQPPTRLAFGVEDAERMANETGYPVAIRMLESARDSPTVLNLWGPHSVRAAVVDLQARYARHHSASEGDRPPVPPMVVQRTYGGSGVQVLSVGVGNDPAFGPMIRFGADHQRDRDGEDHALALPPLNMHLSAELVSRTRIGRRLRGGESTCSAAERAVQTLLVNISQMIVDIPEISGVDFDPIVVDGGQVSVIRATVALNANPGPDRQLAIRPYPEDLEEVAILPNGTKVHLRPIRPEDTPAYERMLFQLKHADMRMRFFGVFNALPRSQLTTLIHIDYDRDMTFIAITESGRSSVPEDEEEILGMVNLVVSSRSNTGEYAVLVRSDRKGLGLGRVLMEKMIRHARHRGLTTVTGVVHKDNYAMLDLCRRLGFSVPSMIDDYFDGCLDSGEDNEREDVVDVRLELGAEDRGVTSPARVHEPIR